MKRPMKERLADESMKRKCNFGMRKLERVGGVYVDCREHMHGFLCFALDAFYGERERERKQ